MKEKYYHVSEKGQDPFVFEEEHFESKYLTFYKDKEKALEENKAPYLYECNLSLNDRSLSVEEKTITADEYFSIVSHLQTEMDYLGKFRYFFPHAMNMEYEEFKTDLDLVSSMLDNAEKPKEVFRALRFVCFSNHFEVNENKEKVLLFAGEGSFGIQAIRKMKERIYG